MRFRIPHRWDLTPKEAAALQQKLRDEVIAEDRLGEVRLVAGLDAGFDDKNTARAAVAVLSFPELELVEQAIARVPVTFPYVPGLLSFRELPALIAALEKLQHLPDLLLDDGQGIAHPRRFGIASHLGVITGIPTIGVAKTRLIGEHGPVPKRRGAWTSLMDGDETIGAVLRTRSGVKPLYISIGHKVSLDTAIRCVMACCTRYRLPETTRWAHRLASG
ncbi:MAG: deoxyribonuclease V [Betaproteobacteria bacterium]|nr:deoxyribonuclease V [Betaproteobacteria bacterium]